MYFPQFPYSLVCLSLCWCMLPNCYCEKDKLFAIPLSCFFFMLKLVLSLLKDSYIVCQEKVIDSSAKTSRLAIQSGLSYAPGMVSNFNDDIISYNGGLMIWNISLVWFGLVASWIMTISFAAFSMNWLL